MTKRLGIKLNDKGTYEYCIVNRVARFTTIIYKYLEKLTKENDYVLIKCGREYHYINFKNDNYYDCDVDRVSYYINKYCL